MKLYQVFAKCVLLSMIIFVASLGASAQTNNSVLWKITGKQIKYPVYLLGTIHLYDTSRYNLPSPVFDKLKEVKSVYFELDFGRLDQNELMQSMWIPDSSQYLNKILDAASFSKLKALVASSSISAAMGDRFYQLKPFYASVILMTGQNAVALDLELYKSALQLKDSVGGIETLGEQLKALNAISIKDQAKMLSEMLKTYTSPEDLLREITDIYIKQDIDHIVTDLNKKMPADNSFNSELIDKRNLIMANRIDTVIKKQGVLIAVGAGHLGGDLGLISLLRKKGYLLSPVVFSFKRTDAAPAK